MKKLSGSLCMDRCTDNHHVENKNTTFLHIYLQEHLKTLASIFRQPFRAISNLDVSLSI